MGWEWHNRARDRKGRFDGQHRTEQLHVRVSEKELERIRAFANAEHMNISEYILHLVQMEQLRAQYGVNLTKNG